MSAKHELLKKVINEFGVLWLLTGLSLCLGPFIPGWLIIPLIVLELLLIVLLILFSSQIIARLFAVASGLTLFTTLDRYVGEIGGDVVLLVFLTTATLFVLYGWFGYRWTKDMKGIGKYLLIALITLVIFSVVSLFIPIGSVGLLVISGAGVLLFSIYTIYDFNQLKHRDFTEEEVPMLAVSLYLDFLNLFLHLLRHVAEWMAFNPSE